MAGWSIPREARRLASACSVAPCPRMACATSPGRISVPMKISTVAANSKRRPSARRWITSFRTGCIPPLPHRPATDRGLRVHQFGVRVGLPAGDGVVMSVDEIVEHRADQAAIVAHDLPGLAVKRLAPVKIQFAPRLRDQPVEVIVEIGRASCRERV